MALGVGGVVVAGAVWWRCGGRCLPLFRSVAWCGRRCAAVGGVVSYLFSAGGGGCIPLLSSGGDAVVVVCIHICIRICGIPMVLAFL